VQFAQFCQNSAINLGHFDRASFLINGTPRDWTDQTDGPALQTLAILQLFGQLDAPTQTVARAVIAANLNFLQNAYQGETFNLWEEEKGASFSARSVQLKCFQAIAQDFGRDLDPQPPGLLLLLSGCPRLRIRLLGGGLAPGSARDAPTRARR
jgi:glucoamylase